jgi:hypothetical protein
VSLVITVVAWWGSFREGFETVHDASKIRIEQCVTVDLDGRSYTFGGLVLTHHPVKIISSMLDHQKKGLKITLERVNHQDLETCAEDKPAAVSVVV